MGAELLQCHVQTGQCAVGAALYLALHANERPLTTSELSDGLGFSVSHLENVLASLGKHDIVTSRRGLGGGYRLSQPAGAISIAAILLAVRSLSRGSDISMGVGSVTEARQITDTFLMALDSRAMNYLAQISLLDLIENRFATKHF
ncbi:RrF2 family transcriptional regulator [Noviherbaspirillum sp. ST9]|uniref:RrF2 family transcriptional regulator n=1 Tax=Noviherbaspirillum sp. ST9 TaxID=3401606 RepID=UPI003B58B181